MTTAKGTDEGQRLNGDAQQLLQSIAIQQRSVDSLAATLTELVQGLNERGRDESVAQIGLIARVLASEIRESNVPQVTKEVSDQIRSYALLKSHLGGQTTTGPLVISRISAFGPPRASVGDPLRIALENAGKPESVAFAAANGVVETNVIRPVQGQVRYQNRLVQTIEVDIPGGAVTGKITVATDAGDLTSNREVQIV